MTIQVIVSWTHDGVGPPTQFNVQRRTQEMGWSQVGVVPYVDGTSEYSFQETIPQVNIRYRVNAENNQGVSEWLKSNIFTVQPGPVSGVVVAAATQV